jgi:hypothetical protein
MFNVIYKKLEQTRKKTQNAYEKACNLGKTPRCL